MTKPLSLKLNGKPFTLHKESSIIGEVRKVLDKLPADEIFTHDEIQKRIPLTSRVRDYYKQLPGYSLRVGQFRYWGNPKAIEALKAQVNQ